MKRRILIRHGESLGNVDPSKYFEMPDHAIPLTQNGIQQAIQAGQQLNNIEGSFGFYYSPYHRAMATMQNIVAQIDPQRIKFCRRDDRLREHETPHKITLSESRERYHNGKYFYRFAHGESCCDVFDRLASQRETALREASMVNADNIVCVGHGTQIVVDLAACLNIDINQAQLIETPRNCAIFVLDFLKDGSYAVSSTSFDQITKRSLNIYKYQFKL